MIALSALCEAAEDYTEVVSRKGTADLSNSYHPRPRKS
jgi:hypothetical protein